MSIPLIYLIFLLELYILATVQNPRIQKDEHYLQENKLNIYILLRGPFSL